MSSVKQITANRANAKLSTGPRTAAGKRKSGMNAVKHGLSAETIVVGNEDPNEFRALCERLEQDFQPETTLEFELVERLAALSWRLRRIPVFETAFIRSYEMEQRAKLKQDRMFDSLSPFHASNNCEDDEAGGPPTMTKLAWLLSGSDGFQNALAKLSRYDAHLMIEFNRTLQQLIFLHSARFARDKQ